MAASERKLIYFDENLSWKISVEVGARGYQTSSASKVGFEGKLDQALLAQLPGVFDEFVLLTGDEAMPLVHASHVKRHGTTIAVVSGSAKRSGVPPNQWNRDTIHRWAHRIATQEDGTIRRYSPTRTTLWTPRRS